MMKEKNLECMARFATVAAGEMVEEMREEEQKAKKGAE